MDWKLKNLFYYNNMTLEEYIYNDVLPQYDKFDAAHHRDHALSVMERSLQIALHYPYVDRQVVWTAAAMHDLGLCESRETHHLASGRIIRSDNRLRQWFSAEQIETIAQAAEDHRASAARRPRSIYGCIVAEADRLIDSDVAISRCLQYGLAHYPELTRDEQIERARVHLQKKYAEGGYLQLLLPDSPNAEPLAVLRSLLKDEVACRKKLNEVLCRLNA